MVLELKGHGFKEPVAKGEESLLKSLNTVEEAGVDNSAGKWEKGQGTECPNGQMVHQKHLDGNIPEMILPATTRSLTDLGMELVFFKDCVCWKRGGTSKFICLKYYLSYEVDTNDSQLEWT